MILSSKLRKCEPGCPTEKLPSGYPRAKASPLAHALLFGRSV